MYESRGERKHRRSRKMRKLRERFDEGLTEKWDGSRDRTGDR